MIENKGFSGQVINSGNKSKTINYSILMVLLVFVSYYLSLNNYLLFHSIAELFSILIAGTMFIIAWNTRRLSHNNYLLFLGVGYLFIAIIDLLHTLSYKGMGVFMGYGANLPTQLWIAARYLESLTLLVSFYFIRNRLYLGRTLISYTALLFILLISIFNFQNFPMAYIDGVGLTRFKIYSEYVIILILALSLVFLSREKEFFKKSSYRFLFGAIVLTIFAELSFTFYVDVYGFSNYIGHIFKICSFYLIYLAIANDTLKDPFFNLFRSLTQRTTAIEQSASVVMITDTSGDIEYVNPQFTKLTGYPVDEVIGENPRFLKSGETPGEVYEELWKTITSGDVWRGEFHNKKKDGSLFWEYATISPVKNLDGEIINFVAIKEDITIRKETENALKMERDKVDSYAKELESSNKLKDLFRDIMTHDLLNPLGNSRAFLDMVLEENPNEKNKFHVNRIMENLNKSIELIERTGDLSKLESAKNIELEDLDLNEIINNVIEGFAPALEKNGMAIEKKFNGNIPIRANGIISEVFYNLISNGIKYGAEGKRIIIENEDLGDSWRIKVTDFGDGIKDEYKGGIFERFNRKEKKGVKGSGLGLAIVKRVVDLHNGKVWVEDNPNGGAVFVVDLLKS